MGAHDLVQDLISEVSSIEADAELCRPVMMEEVEMVLRSMDLNKVSGPDGFSSYFYNHYREIIKSDVLRRFNMFLLWEIYQSSGKQQLWLQSLRCPTLLKDYQRLSSD